MVETRKAPTNKQKTHAKAKHHRNEGHGPAPKTLLMWGAKDQDDPETLWFWTIFGAWKPKTSLSCVTFGELKDFWNPCIHCLFKKRGLFNNPYISLQTKGGITPQKMNWQAKQQVFSIARVKLHEFMKIHSPTFCQTYPNLWSWIATRTSPSIGITDSVTVLSTILSEQTVTCNLSALRLQELLI